VTYPLVTSTPRRGRYWDGPDPIEEMSFASLLNLRSSIAARFGFIGANLVQSAA